MRIKNFKEAFLLLYYSSKIILIITDSTVFPNFIDQQRFSLPEGNYEFELLITDNNRMDSISFQEPIEIIDAKDKMDFSDIQLIESYKKAETPGILTKSGYDLVPYVSDFFPKSMSKITFYAELYNSHKILSKDDKYLINYMIVKGKEEEIFQNYKGFVRQTVNEVNVVFNEFNITELPSGNYYLKLEARNKTNQLLASKKVFFQRSNSSVDTDINPSELFSESITDREKLISYIKSLRPLATESERPFIDKRSEVAELTMLQRFFANFWLSRNAIEPETSWLTYLDNVKLTDELYATRVSRGYETDRGVVYLKYGKPNSVNEVKSEPSAYPYEIWQYYKIGVQSNVKFVFYNPDMGTGDYVLLHSNLVGEINDPRWQFRLQKRNNASNDFDIIKGDDHYGTRQEDYFNTPR